MEAMNQIFDKRDAEEWDEDEDEEEWDEDEDEDLDEWEAEVAEEGEQWDSPFERFEEGTGVDETIINVLEKDECLDNRKDCQKWVDKEETLGESSQIIFLNN